MPERRITRRGLLQGTLAAGAVLGGCASRRQQTEVVVYGATPGGIASAVTAARLGHSVILCDHQDHIGGIVSNGLTNADIGKRQAVGGLFYEFTRRVVKHYEEVDQGNLDRPNVKLCRNGYWYEANAAEEIFHEMIAEQSPRIRVMLSHELKRAVVRDNRLTGIVLEAQDPARTQVQLDAVVFIDATYEGDLAAAAGAPFRTGRESRAEFNEPHAGRIYLRFRDTELLPGSTGEGDNATQAYCFRFHVTNSPEKRVRIEKPAAYNRDDYYWVLEDIRAGRATTFRHIIQVYPMPRGRFELNSDHPHPETGVPKESLDLAEENWEWPTATLARRREIYQRYLSHNVGMIWLLQNDPEVPEALRADASQYGWHRDEWTDNGHMPRQVYVRQGRRIVGEYTLTERDADLDLGLKRTEVRPDSIATIEWAFDPHGHHKYDPAHPGVREGYFYLDHAPFQAPYGILVPKKIDGLLVPVACSCSHVAYNALRMEPVFMALGEATGMAAHLSIDSNVTPREVPPAVLQRLLVERGAVVTFFEDVPFNDPHFEALQYLGARGLNRGYRAGMDELLTRADGAERLARILQYEGRFWKMDGGKRAAPLSAAELAKWLAQAGYKAASSGPRQMDVADFTSVVYRALTS
jgi:hypothetical protein